MIFFIPWVIFLLFVILAIPVTSMLEKRKYKAAMADQYGDESFGEEAVDDGGAEMLEATGDEAAGFGDVPEPAGGNDFSAFDEEFK